MDGAGNLQWLLNDQAVTSADVQTALKVHAEYAAQDDPSSSIKLNVFKAEDIDTGTSAPVDMTRTLGQAASSYGATAVDGIWTTPDTGGGSFYFYVTIGDPAAGGVGTLSPQLTVGATVTIAPATGDAAGGTDVRISLTNAFPVASAEIGGVPITEFAVDSTGLAVTGKTGAHDAGAVDVVLKDGSGTAIATAAGAFTYNPSDAPAPAATGAPSNLAWQKDSAAVTDATGGDALTLSWDLAHDDANQVTVAVYGGDQVDASGALVSGATALDPAPTATENSAQTGFTADWTVPATGDSFYFQVSVQGAAGDPATALSDKLAVAAPAAPSKPRFDKDGAQPTDDPITQALPGDKVDVSATYPAHGDDVTPTLKIYNATDVPDPTQIPGDSVTPLATIDDAAEADDKLSTKGSWTVAAPPAAADGTASTGVYALVTVGTQSTLSDLFTVSPPLGPSNLRWDPPGTDVSGSTAAAVSTSLPDPLGTAAVGDSVQLSCRYTARADGTQPPTVAVYDAKDAGSLANATPVAPVTITENDDKSGFTATWTVTPPWKKQADPAAASDPSSDPSNATPASLTSGQSNDVTASTAAVSSIQARKPGGASGADPGAGGADPNAGASSGSDPNSTASGTDPNATPSGADPNAGGLERRRLGRERPDPLLGDSQRPVRAGGQARRLRRRALDQPVRLLRPASGDGRCRRAAGRDLRRDARGPAAGDLAVARDHGRGLAASSRSPRRGRRTRSSRAGPTRPTIPSRRRCRCPSGSSRPPTSRLTPPSSTSLTRA